MLPLLTRPGFLTREYFAGRRARYLELLGQHEDASRERAQASELISAVNRGLKELKETDAYAAIVRSHLMRLWNGNASAP